MGHLPQQAAEEAAEEAADRQPSKKPSKQATRQPCQAQWPLCSMVLACLPANSFRTRQVPTRKTTHLCSAGSREPQPYLRDGSPKLTGQRSDPIGPKRTSREFLGPNWASNQTSKETSQSRNLFNRRLAHSELNLWEA